MTPEPPSEAVLLSRFRPVVLEKDTEVNFTIAVHERVSDATTLSKPISGLLRTFVR